MLSSSSHAARSDVAVCVGLSSVLSRPRFQACPFRRRGHCEALRSLIVPRRHSRFAGSFIKGFIGALLVGQTAILDGRRRLTAWMQKRCRCHCPEKTWIEVVGILEDMRPGRCRDSCVKDPPDRTYRLKVRARKVREIFPQILGCDHFQGRRE